METVKLYPGIEFTLPPKPKKENIFFHDLPKKEQRWRRIPVPDVIFSDGVTANLFDLDFSLVNELYEANHPVVRPFIEEDDRRCTEGIWFYNNGTPTYITGYHYEYLQWDKLDIGHPLYFDKDRRWYYFTQVCLDDPECMGELYGKKRRDGFSYRAMSIVLASARRTFNAEYGMMSKTGEDAVKLFEKCVYAFRNYPPFYKPQVFTAEDVKKELFFKEPQQRVSRKNNRVSYGISLNTKINYRNTKDNSYDGAKLKVLVGDEIAKMKDGANFEKWLAVVTTCLTQGRKIVGKFIGGSSVEDAESGGKEFKKVWDKSNPLEKVVHGRTLSGLYRYFTPASDGLEGFIDEYGMSVIDTPEKPVMGIDGIPITRGAKDYLLERRRVKKEAGDMVGYYEECRQFPLNEEEMFLDPANETTSLPVDKIYQQIEINNSFASLPLRRGNFIWKDGIRDSLVVFVDDPAGRWLVYWMPKEDQRNKQELVRGRKSPGNKGHGLFSVDPFDHKTTTEGKGSNAASHGYRKADVMDQENSDICISEYLARPMDPYQFYEDMICQCVFYGWEILGENNKPGCKNHFENRGYYHYLMDRPAITHTEYSEEHQKDPKWLPTTGDAVRNSLVNYLASYIYQKIGINDQTGKCGKMFFNRTLKDWLVFKAEGRWTDWDLTVSYMLLVVGSLSYIPKKKEPKKLLAFPRYQYNGLTASPYKEGQNDIPPNIHIVDM